MGRVKTYDFRKYSVLDIKHWLEEKEWELEYISSTEKAQAMYRILGTDVIIYFPSIVLGGTRVSAGIAFEDYPKSVNYEKSKKLFEALKRKFGVKPEEFTEEFQKSVDKIKDADKIEVKDFSKNPFWPF